MLTPHTYSSRRYVLDSGGGWQVVEKQHPQKFVTPETPSSWRERVTIEAATAAPYWLVETLPKWVNAPIPLRNENLLGTVVWSIAGQACSVWAEWTEAQCKYNYARALHAITLLATINDFMGGANVDEELTRAREVIETSIYSNMVGVDEVDGKPILPGIAVNAEVSLGKGDFHYDPDFYGSSWDGESLGAVLAKSIENERLGSETPSAILPAFNAGGFTVVGIVAASAWATGIEELANKTFRLSSSHSGINSNMSCDL